MGLLNTIHSTPLDGSKQRPFQIVIRLTDEIDSPHHSNQGLSNVGELQGRYKLVGFCHSGAPVLAMERHVDKLIEKYNLCSAAGWISIDGEASFSSRCGRIDWQWVLHPQICLRDSWLWIYLVRPESCDRVALPVEDYLHSVISVVNELVSLHYTSNINIVSTRRASQDWLPIPSPWATLTNLWKYPHLLKTYLPVSLW